MLERNPQTKKLHGGDLQILTNLLCEEVINLAVARDSGRSPGLTIDKNAVTPALSQQIALMPSEVSDQIDPLHAAESSKD